MIWGNRFFFNYCTRLTNKLILGFIVECVSCSAIFLEVAFRKLDVNLFMNYKEMRPYTFICLQQCTMVVLISGMANYKDSPKATQSRKKFQISSRNNFHKEVTIKLMNVIRFYEDRFVLF